MKHIKYSVFIFAAGLALSSCEKELDQQDPNQFTEKNAFLSMDDIQQGANGAYARYGTYNINNVVRGTYPSDMYVNALLSDEAKLGLDNAGQGLLTYRYQFSADNTTGADVITAFGGYYTLIDQVNRVLPHIATVTAKPEQEPRRNIVRGQLLALRALGHFGLLQAYCKNYNPADPKGVPIMLESDPLAKPARNSMGEVMAQIEKDLNDAKALLPDVTPATFSDTVMNKVNIAAYQARIALYRKDYQAAINYATEVINSNVKPLVTGNDFAGIWKDENQNELLFRIRFSADPTGTFIGIGALWTTTGNQYYVEPSSKLVDAYDDNDIRKDIFIGTAPLGNSYVNKFHASSRGGRIVDLKACRIAEMYLIRAEAHAKKSSPDVAAGAADLNALRAKRITGYVNENFASAADLITAVLNERFKELCFEGFRFYDLKRNNLPVQRNASDANAAWQTLPADSYRFVLPIPQDERLANPNMVQNDGY